jgi:hypothetical protein
MNGRHSYSAAAVNLLHAWNGELHTGVQLGKVHVRVVLLQ